MWLSFSISYRLDYEKINSSCKQQGIRWNFTTKLDDFDYADDIALLSSTRELQQKFSNLSTHVHSIGLKINAAKTKVMKLNANSIQAFNNTDEQAIDVNKFTYLGAIMTSSGGTKRDIKERLGLARTT